MRSGILWGRGVLFTGREVDFTEPKACRFYLAGTPFLLRQYPKAARWKTGPGALGVESDY